MAKQVLGMTLALLLGVACNGKNDCERVVPEALRSCLTTYGAALKDCYNTDGKTCESDNSALATSLEILRTEVEGACEDEEWKGLTQSELTGRLEASCVSEANTVSWRAYGGPQGAVYSTATAEDQSCMNLVHDTSVALMDQHLVAINECLAQKKCDGDALQSTRDAATADSRSALEASCPNIAKLIAVTPYHATTRAHHQADCVTATAHQDPADIGLKCGPTYTQFEGVRGEWTQVVVDGDKWGTLCGDGSDYAFQIRLAPDGEPLDRVVIGLQGGGVCVFEEDCSAKLASNPGLFNAIDDLPFEVGIVSSDTELNPFANWTTVYLPYCNQDVFAGGGVNEELGNLTLPRYGAINIRAAIQMTRDLLWKMQDEEDGPGYRPDEMHALFGGWSAGAYGTMYNYHWMLDELQWPRTTAFPDAGLGLHNGEAIGVLGLGLLKIPAWGAQPHLPPYCFRGECAVGPTLFEAISPRLKQVPEQQMLVMTNPKDRTQQYDAYFSDEADWINSLRQAYCDTKELNGINYYLTSISDESVHVITLRNDLWVGEVDGEAMRDWMWRAYADPDTVQDRAEEANFVADVPGVEPFPCEVAP